MQKLLRWLKAYIEDYPVIMSAALAVSIAVFEIVVIGMYFLFVFLLMLLQSPDQGIGNWAELITLVPMLMLVVLISAGVIYPVLLTGVQFYLLFRGKQRLESFSTNFTAERLF